VIFANTLSSSHVFKLTRELGGDVRVIDRNLLILEVFDRRAMTKEAKIQIRLAKLKYTLSWGKEFIKLKGIMGEQLGWMGPGDYPYEEYYKGARRQISRLEEVLEDIHRKKNLRRERRRELGFPIVALAGYTQSGKTTFFNRLATEDKTVGLGPFTTLTTFARKVNNGYATSHKEFILIDSIGFIDDMHPIILKAFNSTIGEITNADLVLLFVDGSESQSEVSRKLRSMRSTIQEIKLNAETIVCINKVDLMSAEASRSAAEEASAIFDDVTIVSISALTGQGLDELLRLLDEKLAAVTPIPSTR
jgi:GTP-binding protein HflX